MWAYVFKFGPLIASVVLLVVYSRCEGFVRGTIGHFLFMTLALTLIVYGSSFELKHSPGFTLWNSQLSPVRFDQPGPAPDPQFVPRSDKTYRITMISALMLYITLPAALFRSATVFGRERFGSRWLVIHVILFVFNLAFIAGDVLLAFIVAIDSLVAPSGYRPYNTWLMLAGCLLVGAILYAERLLRKKRVVRTALA